MRNPTSVDPMDGGSLPLVRCTRDEYALLANYCRTVAEAKSVVMDNGVVIANRSNRCFYASPIAFRVAFGRELSGLSTRTRTRGDRVL